MTVREFLKWSMDNNVLDYEIKVDSLCRWDSTCSKEDIIFSEEDIFKESNKILRIIL